MLFGARMVHSGSISARVAKINPMMYCPRGYAAGRAGEDVIEHQCRDRNFCEKASQGLFDYSVNTATNKQCRTLDVNGAYGVN